MFTEEEERFYLSARAWARRQAFRFRLDNDLADDFEQSFVDVRTFLEANTESAELMKPNSHAILPMAANPSIPIRSCG